MDASQAVGVMDVAFNSRSATFCEKYLLTLPLIVWNLLKRFRIVRRARGMPNTGFDAMAVV